MTPRNTGCEPAAGRILTAQSHSGFYVNILLCPLSDGGYLYPSLAVGRELRDRGHRVSVLGRALAGPAVSHAGLPFIEAEARGGEGGFSVRWWFQRGVAQYRAVLRAVPEAGAEIIVASELSHGVLLAAEVLDLPVVVLGLAAYMWDYVAGGEGEPRSPADRAWRTREAMRFYGLLRAEVGLAARKDRRPETPLLGDGFLLRGDPALEYPGGVLPARARHVGPCPWEPAATEAELAEIDAHLERVGKPVVYVHLGRRFNGLSMWPRLNAAFTGGPFQAIVERGRTRAEEPRPGADILLVRKPWLGPLIDRAGLVLCSGTSAPVLNALLRGRPLVVSPAGSEQPLLSEACVRAGVAAYLPQTAGPEALATLVSAWHDAGLHRRAGELGRRLAASDSARRAADAIARVASGLPVASGGR